MSTIKDTAAEQKYWTQRYEDNQIEWNIGSPSTPIKEYINQLEDKEIRILIPGAGNGYEAEYFFRKGFKNTHILDISEIPLKSFKHRNPKVPEDQIIHGNFFEHEGQYDLIIEQTFFCSFPPTAENRQAYAKKMHSLLADEGKLVGLWFDIPLEDDMEKRPFGGDREDYLEYLYPFFITYTFESSYNSIEAREGEELFGIFVKRQLDKKSPTKK